MLPAPALIAIGIAIALVVLIPSRRLQLAGFRARWIALYAACLWGLAFLLAIRPAATRFLIPILVIAFIAPFVVAPERMSRIVRRRGPDDPPRPPMKDVTPPDPPGGEG
jgi:hypothetical protein